MHMQSLKHTTCTLERTNTLCCGVNGLSGGCLFLGARARSFLAFDGRKEIIRLRVSDTGSRVALVVARQQIIFRLLAFKASQGHSLFGDLDERSVWRALARSHKAACCCISLSLARSIACIFAPPPPNYGQRTRRAAARPMQGCAAGQIR
jgi:hypothetical protein